MKMNINKYLVKKYKKNPKNRFSLSFSDLERKELQTYRVRKEIFSIQYSKNYDNCYPAFLHVQRNN